MMKMGRDSPYVIRFAAKWIREAANWRFARAIAVVAFAQHSQ